jgi:hypothetical protein
MTAVWIEKSSLDSASWIWRALTSGMGGGGAGGAMLGGLRVGGDASRA